MGCMLDVCWMWGSLVVLGVCLGVLMWDRDAPGDVKTGRCAKGTAWGCGRKSLLLQAKEGKKCLPSNQPEPRKQVFSRNLQY